ncbi:MAG TPA: FKBP-type peptidyl-prolyl cis-trans isomerase [Fimbriiglobus sp.]|jgi:hypothetical protein
MTPVRFPLCLDRLDDRIVPSIADALDAANFVELARGPIQDLAHRLGETVPKREAATIRTAYFGIAEGAFAADQTLSTFLSEVQTTIAANPGNTSLYTLANRTWDEIALARLEYSYANTFAVLYGGFPFTPGGSTTNPDNDPNLRTTIPDLNAPGWVTQPDGLRIRDRIVGTGPAVTAGATITVEYIGWLLDGTVFDSSAQHGGTSQFSLSGVIQGWQEGIPGMKPGGIRQLDIPANLAYGSAGQGSIPPNSELVFEIKMISSP